MVVMDLDQAKGELRSSRPQPGSELAQSALTLLFYLQLLGLVGTALIKELGEDKAVFVRTDVTDEGEGARGTGRPRRGDDDCSKTPPH